MTDSKFSFQERVEPWMDQCFGREVSMDRLERGDRFLEEALELLQSGDYPPERIGKLVDYVYARPKGEPSQEVGGVMITLAAYCLAHGLDMHAAGETELARIWTKVEQIRAKQASKPRGSALPIAVDKDEEDSCYACQEAFVEGDPIYYERDGGYLHAACCGPDRIAFCSSDEGPLTEGEPIPRPLIWTADQKKALPLASDEVNDDVCVNRFAAEMRGKLHAARRNGRSGWDDPKQCSLAELSAMLLDQVRKGDPLDVANFAMMLHQRGGRISMGGWQDIDTAPMNTDVLVYWPIVKLDDDGDPTDEIVGGNVLISENQGGHWIEPEVMNALGDHMGDEETYAENPSHWAPKPSAPPHSTNTREGA